MRPPRPGSPPANRRIEAATLGQREDEIRAADARVAAGPRAAGRDRRAHQRHGAGRAGPGAGRGGLLPARRMGGGQPADRRPDPRRSRLCPLLRARGSGRRLPAGRARPLPLRRLPGQSRRDHFLCQPAARIHAADHLQPRSARPAGVHGRGAAGKWRRPRSRPAGRRLSGRRPARRRRRDGHDRRHRRRGPQQVLRRPARRQGLLDRGRAGPDHRLPRPQRLGQDHDPAHALRPAHAGQRPRHRAGLRHPHREPGRSSAAPAT